MKQIIAIGPQVNLKITDIELSAAKEVKEQTKDVLKKLDLATKIIVDFKDAIIQQRPSRDDLSNKYRGKLLRYRRKITTVFNDFLFSVKSILEKLSVISDPDMDRLKQILVAEVGELSDGAGAVLDLLQTPDKDSFSQTLERITAQIEKRSKSIKEVIDSQLLGHVDTDILGKMKISELRFRMRRRARIIKQLARRV